MTPDATIAVGECPDHGVVTGDDVTVEFPITAECHCGRDLYRATYATREEVERYA